MSDELSPKPPGLGALSGRSTSGLVGQSRRLPGRTGVSTWRRDFAADLLQMQRPPIADATVCCSWRQPRAPARCIDRTAGFYTLSREPSRSRSVPFPMVPSPAA